MLITPEMCRRNRACYTDERLREVLGAGKTPREVLDLAIPAADRVWALTRPGVLADVTLRLFACACATRVLPLFESRHPDDERPRMAIDVAVQFALGCATREELAAAWAAAWAAARDAAWDAAGDAARAAARDAARAAAGDAAWAAARAAAGDAARAAAGDAARAAARAAQIEDLRALLGK